MILILALSGLIIAFGALGGLMEAIAPATAFPKGWTSEQSQPLTEYPAHERAFVGALFAMLYIALFVGFGSANLLAATSASELSVATLVKALLSGLAGARMVRMRICVPIALLWAFIRGGIGEVRKNPIKSDTDEAQRAARRSRRNGKGVRGGTNAMVSRKRAAPKSSRRPKDPPFPPTGASPVLA